MTKKFNPAFIIPLFFLLLSPSLLFAETYTGGDDLFYDKPGFDPNRITESFTYNL